MAFVSVLSCKLSCIYWNYRILVIFHQLEYHFDNIKMQEGTPTWRITCQCCLACLNYVPVREYMKLKTKRME
jgi:hypothetical protein